jgi:hypothetical protein
VSPSRTLITFTSTLTCWLAVEAGVVAGVVGKGAIVVGVVVSASDEVGAEVVGVVVGSKGFEVVCCVGVGEGSVLFGVASGCGLVILDCTTTDVDWFVD